MVYHIMHLDIPVIDIEADRCKRMVSYTKHLPDTDRKQVFRGDINAERLYTFLKDRCYEDGRRDLPEILEAHGMTYNDPYIWCQKTHGVTYEDFLWVKVDDEKITWEEVKSVSGSSRGSQGRY